MFAAFLLLGALRMAADWQELPGGRWRALDVPAAGQPGFVPVEPSDSGLIFTNVLREADGAQNRTLYNGSGVATADFDGDGLPDVALAGLEGQLSLFRNAGNWRFADVTAGSGVIATNYMARGVVFADLDGDGAPELLLSANGAGVRCWHNDGHGHFTDMTDSAGTASRLGSMTLALADVNGDGTPDLYVANNRTDDIRDRGQVQLQQVRGRMVVPAALTNRLLLAEGQLLEYGEPDRLLFNDGKGRFTPAPWDGGTFLDERGEPLTAAPLDWGLSATFRDFNGDGLPDLYVCNDFWTPDRMWLNDGKGHLQAAPALALRKTSGSSMGIDVADVDLDGAADFFVVDMLSRDPAWRKRQMAAQREVPGFPGVFADRPQVLRNTLQIGRGDGTFYEAADYAGLAAAEWAWQPLFLDVDLDGWPDLLITTGHAHDVQDRDAQAAVEARQRNYAGIASAADRRRAFTRDLLANMQLYPPLTTPIVAFRNRGHLRFEEVTPLWGTGLGGIHHGIATADFDGDGDLDLVVNRLNAPALLFRNRSSAPRVAVRLRGRAPNTGALGAKVTLRGGPVPAQTQEVVAGGRYLSGCDPLLVFAAGGPATALSITIRWRDGREQQVDGIRPNRLYEFTEGPAETPAGLAATDAPSTWFEDISGRLSDLHLEPLYDDFARQPLLPRKLSQPGPGVAWFDWNGDGWDDLAIGAGSASALGLFQNDGKGGFKAVPGETTGRDQVALVALGGTLLAGLSNFEDGQTNGLAVQSFVAAGTAPEGIPASADTLGALALGDVDGDGTLELFVGGRTIPGRWPEPASSAIYRLQGGHWTPVQRFPGLGMVTSACWTDLTGDGLPELALACEWGPVRLFRNVAGKLELWNPQVRVTGDGPGARVPLTSLTGWWNGVAAGDFDGDGRLDLAAANWGENSPFSASPGSPLTLIAGDWPGDGSLGLIETVRTVPGGQLTPSRPLTELISGLPFLVGRFRSFRAYAESGLDEVLGAEKSRAREYSATELRSGIFLNRGDHLEWRPLPAAAQMTPAFSPVVADFDGNGTEDLFLSQNFFATRAGLARLDAGLGLLLSGDGLGGFQAVAAATSGLRIYGEQRGAAAADFDQDGRTDLAVGQNGTATRLFRNATAETGVRVRLFGPSGNPAGLGARLRIVGGQRPGPVRELHGGSGAGSQDSSVTVLARPGSRGSSMQIEVTWPGGTVQSVPLEAGAREVSVRRDSVRP